MKISYSQIPALKIMSPMKFKEFERSNGFTRVWRSALNENSANPSDKEFFESYRNDILDGNMKATVYMPVTSFIDALQKWYTKETYEIVRDVPFCEVFKNNVAFVISDDSVLLGRIKSPGQYELSLVMNSGIAFVVNFHEGNDSTVVITDGFWDSPIKNDTSFITNAIEMFKTFLVFMKFAPVETDIISGNSKVKSSIYGCKVRNEGDIDVVILDSRWFREIIRTNGFSVRGHFRLQPCKDDFGNWTRKLIWIESFEKHGYHRKAIVNF